MRTIWMLALVMVAIHPVSAVETGDPGPESGDSTSTEDSIAEGIPCSPVAAYWTGPPQAPGMPQGPELAIVSTDIRPKDARLLVDGRLVGRTRYLDGTPGYLYLEPGSYRIEIRFDGYATVVINLSAEVGCRYDLKHRMERVQGVPKEKKVETGGKAKPFHRVFSPIETEQEVLMGTSSTRPDMSLRSDLGAAPAGLGSLAPDASALKLKVSPEEASVSIDGSFVATGRELARMQGPLAIPHGSHTITVGAPGFESVTRTLEVSRGEVLEIVFDLSPDRTH